MRPVRVFLIFFLLCHLLAAEENPYRTVVSEQAEETPATGATTVITEKEIEKKQKGQVADLLRETPGIHVATAGGAGALTSLFIRGGKAGHALVLLDGVRLNDPLSVENAADLSDITADAVSRIEILRGPQAVIYGPDAMSGVVRIVTKRGGGRPALSLTGESGLVDLSTDHIAVNHLRTGASLRGGTENGDYAAAIYYRDTGGYSAAAGHDGNIEEDRSRLLTLNGRAHLFLSDHLTLGASIRAASADTDLDNGPGRYRDDINHTFESDRLFGRVSLDGSFFDGQWLPSWSVAVSHHACDDRNAPDGTGDEWGFSHAGFRGETVEASWRNDITALPLQRLRAGLVFNAGFGGSDHRTDREHDITALDIGRKDTYGLGLYLQDIVSPVEGLDLTAGGRFDLFIHRTHDTAIDSAGSTVVADTDRLRMLPRGTFGVEAAYRVAATDTRLRAGAGSAFKPPSLFQLYSRYGSEFLRPEETLAFDGGIEQRFWDRRVSLEVNGFYQETRDLIEFSYGCDGMLCGRYRNLGWLVARGVEAIVVIRPDEQFTISANYTFTDTDSWEIVSYDGGRWRDTRPVLRRPVHLANLWADWTPDNAFNANFSLTVIGPRNDIEYRYPYQPAVVRLPPAVIGSLALTVRPGPLVDLFARLENLFDERYELVRGYGTPGLSLYGGMRFHFEEARP